MNHYTDQARRVAEGGRLGEMVVNHGVTVGVVRWMTATTEDRSLQTDRRHIRLAGSTPLLTGGTAAHRPGREGLPMMTMAIE